MPTTVAFLLEMPGHDRRCRPPARTSSGPTSVAPPDIQQALVNPDAGALNLVFRTGPGSLDERAVYVNEIRDELEAGETARRGRSCPRACGPRRRAWRWWASACSRTSSPTASCSPTWPSLFVFLFLTVRLRSVVRALLSMVPVLIAVGAASLVAWAFDLQLSPMTAVGGPLVVALCTEFTSLILLRFIEERQPRLLAARGRRRHRVPHRPGLHRVGAAPRCRAWRSSPSRRCRCCGTSA